MTNKGEKTLEEILSQPAVWEDTLKVFKKNVSAIEALWNQENYDQVIFSGCGSTYYLSQAAAVIFQKFTGVTTIALPGSELSLFGDVYLDKNKKTLLIAVSRSGETSETVRAMELFKDGNYGRIMTITTVPNSSVTKFADLNLIAEAAQEVSIAQTRSFASMMLLAEALAVQLGGQDAVEVLAGFPERVKYFFDTYHELAEKLGTKSSIERFFFLGSAYNYGIAMVDENSLIVGLVNESTQNQEIPVLEEMASLKGQILAFSEKSNPRLEAIGDVVELNSGVDEPLRALLFLPVMQLLAFHRAISRGQDPDNPHNLDAVVHIPSMTTG